MSKVAVGSLPEKICYVASKEMNVSVGCRWDIDYDGTDEKVKVLPTFPTDASDTKALARAKTWANNKIHSSKIVDNKPIKNVKVVSLEERGRGGRAYKVLIDDYYVDLREDVLMDTLLKVGIKSGGVLNGEFIWSKMGSQMKLIRVNSELHKLITEFSSKKDMKSISDLEIGGVYQNKKKEKAIFVGYISTTKYSLEDKTASYKKITATFDYIKTPVKKAMLFFKLYGDKISIKDMKIRAYAYHGEDEDDVLFNYEIKRAHTYIEKVAQKDIPNDIIEFLRAKALKKCKNSILELTGDKPPKKGYQKVSDTHVENEILYYSEYLNMYPFGKEIVAPFDIKMYLTLS